jgi:defect-in-organelle-trafficking protein DotB
MNESFLLPNEPTRFVPNDLERLLLHCEQFKASDITLQTGQYIMMEVYGQLHALTTRRMNNVEVSEILNSIYGPNATTQILAGHDVDTHFEFRPNRFERYRYRVNGTGCQVEGHDGIQITLRSIPANPPMLDDLQLEADILQYYAPLEGVVYVTGATGSGKSTLLASMIRSLVERPDGNRKALTYESPIEFVFDGIEMPTSLVSQTEIPRHLPSFAAGVRNALRRKPGLILVGEARDPETISAVIDAALTGHPVYTTLHTNGVAETIRRLVTAFPVDERHGRTVDILETVRLIIWQKLVPSTDGKRVALREYMIFNDEVRDALLACNLDHVTAKSRELLKIHGQEMLMDAQRKFDAGQISAHTLAVLKAGAMSADHDASVAV